MGLFDVKWKCNALVFWMNRLWLTEQTCSCCSMALDVVLCLQHLLLACAKKCKKIIKYRNLNAFVSVKTCSFCMVCPWSFLVNNQNMLGNYHENYWTMTESRTTMHPGYLFGFLVSYFVKSLYTANSFNITQYYSGFKVLSNSLITTYDSIQLKKYRSIFIYVMLHIKFF